MHDSDSASIDRLFDPWDRLDQPGGAIAIYQDGEIVYKRGFGAASIEHAAPNTPSTVFHLASLAKQFTAIAVALLARDGALSLDGDIRRHIPELPPGPRISPRQIIHHISGLRDQWDLLAMAGWRPEDLKTTSDILQLLSRQRALNFEPGSRYQYINSGYTLLAVTIERVTGQSFQRVCQERIFGPLGMSDTRFADRYGMIVPRRASAYARNQDGTFEVCVPAYETVGPTGLLSTVEDFAHWERNFLHPVVGGDELVRAIATPGALEDGSTVQYGLGALLGTYRGLSIIEHAGGDAGFRAHYLRMPEARWAVALFCNGQDFRPGLLARQIADICLADVLGEATASPAGTAWAGRAAGAAVTSREALQAKVGTYRESSSGGTLRIELRGEQLFLIPSQGGTYELVTVDPDRFRFTIVDAECRFEAQAGSAMRLTVWHAGQLTGDAERIDDQHRAPGDLEPYAGTYASTELGVSCQIMAAGGELRMHRAKLGDFRLEPTFPDEFFTTPRGWHLEFQRDENGRVTGFRMSAERAWKITFERTGHPDLLTAAPLRT